MKTKTILIAAALGGSLMLANGYAANHDKNNSQSNQNNTMQNTGKIVSDSQITKHAKAKISADKLINKFKLTVSTKDGVVHLSGKVDSDAQYERVITLVESVDGVKDTKADKLTVKDSKQPMQDTYITAKIKGLILRNKLMGEDVQYWSVNVETKNGVVFLTGKVESDQQKQKILDIVNSVNGVKSVNSDLKVEAAANTDKDQNKDTNSNQDQDQNTDQNQNDNNQ